MKIISLSFFSHHASILQPMLQYVYKTHSIRRRRKKILRYPVIHRHVQPKSNKLTYSNSRRVVIIIHIVTHNLHKLNGIILVWLMRSIGTTITVVGIKKLFNSHFI